MPRRFRAREVRYIFFEGRVVKEVKFERKKKKSQRLHKDNNVYFVVKSKVFM